MQKILLAYDGSDASRHAAARAADLAVRLHGSVLVLTVGELLESGYGTEVPVVEPEIYDGVVEAGVAAARQAGAQAEGRLEWGRPADTVVRVANDEGCDLIVVGHRGHNPLEELLIGSVAKQVMDHAHCSVLVVR